MSRKNIIKNFKNIFKFFIIVLIVIVVIVVIVKTSFLIVNIMGISQSKNNSDSINWDNINTESMSSTLPALKKISNDAEQLISKLDITQNINMNDTDSDSENLFSWISNIDKPDNTNNNDIEFSDTSAFISSDMYKYLMNNSDKDDTSSHMGQVGGAINEDSSTSSTSSSVRKGSKGTKSTKGAKKSNKRNNRRVTESSSVLSGGNLSYLSSSAHTSENRKQSSSADSVNETSVSIGNNQMLTSSIATSDINMISSDSN